MSESIFLIVRCPIFNSTEKILEPPFDFLKKNHWKQL
jgi:hypothetical protein